MNAQTENILRRRERLHAIKVRDARVNFQAGQIPSVYCDSLFVLCSNRNHPQRWVRSWDAWRVGARHSPVPPLPVAAPARGRWGRLVHVGVHLVLEDVQVVGGCDSDDVLGRVPGRVQDLLGEVQAVHADVASQSPLAARTRVAGTHGACSPQGPPGSHPAWCSGQTCGRVVVGSSHDDAGGRRRRGRQLGPGGGGRKPAAPSGGCRAIAGMGTPWEQTGIGLPPPLLWGGVGGILLSPHHIWAASAHKLRAGS